MPFAIVISQQPTILSLEGFLAQVEQRFPKLIGAEAERRAVSAKRQAKQGAFDPQITVGTEALRYNSASTRGKASAGANNEIGVEVATPYGLKLAAGRDWNAGGVKSPNSATGNEGNYFLYGKLPLGRGGGINDKLVALTQARLAEPAATLSVVGLRQNTLLEVSLAYFEWSGAVQKLQIAQKLLDVGIFRATGLKKELAVGAQARIIITEAEAEVERRRASFIKAQRDLDKATFKLAKFAWDGVDLFKLSPEPLSSPELLAESVVATALQRAQELRPELKLIALQTESIRLEGKLAQNDLKPAVDLVFSPGADFGNKSVGLNYKFGIAASIPLYQNDAKGRREEAFQKEQKLTREAELMQRNIELEVRDASNAIQRTQQRFLA
ncbi:TolC family protein, partial [Armatimonas sp.]|uniref:TolC family protein n=1 Tax=Armatimonas sp. TaxID=1872638 RepID=UPI00286D1985